MTTAVSKIRRRIVETQEKGEDTTDLEKKLKLARLDEVNKAEVAELRKVADKRIEWRQKAEKIQEKVKLQGEAIERFLEIRNNLVAPMKELIELADSAGLIKAQLDCYAGYNDIGQFSWTVRSIPKGFLPDDFACPMLSMAGGLVDARDKAAEALYYLKAAYGILASMEQVAMVGETFQHEVDEGL